MIAADRHIANIDCAGDAASGLVAGFAVAEIGGVGSRHGMGGRFYADLSSGTIFPNEAIL
jgi:hypothetical protein